MRNLEFDRSIDRHARRQFGAFNMEQVRRAGGTRKMSNDRVDAELWYQLANNVFALASFPPTWRRAYKAAELWTPGAGINRSAAGQLHGLDGVRNAPAQLVIPYTTKMRCPLAKLHRSTGVPLTVVDGITVTTVAQTLYDLLFDRRIDEVERAMDGAILVGKTTVDELEERHVVLVPTRKPHVGTFGELIAARKERGWAPSESELEFLGWPILQSIPGTMFVRQAPLPWRRQGAGRVDAICEQWRLIVEFDGRRWHNRVADFDKDAWRDAEGTAHGYRTIRFSWVHVKERPLEVAELIAAAGRWRLSAAS